MPWETYRKLPVVVEATEIAEEVAIQTCINAVAGSCDLEL